MLGNDSRGLANESGPSLTVVSPRAEHGTITVYANGTLSHASDANAGGADRKTTACVTLLACATIIGPAAINILLPALPDAAKEFSVSYGEIQWAISLYMGTLGAAQLVVGPMADKYGRRKVLLGGLAIFSFGSIVAFLAGGLAALIVGRMIQAVGNGALVNVPRSMARDTLDGRELARTMAILVGAQALGPAIAPALGGFLTSMAGWRSTLGASAAFALLILAWSWKSCRETLLSRSTFAITPAGLWCRYRPLLANRGFLAHGAMYAGTSGGFYTMLTYAPKHLIVDLGLAPDTYGMVVLLGAGGFFCGTMVSVSTVKRIGYAKLILAGAWLCAAGIAALGLLPESNSAIPVLIAMFTYSAGNGLVFPNAMYGALQQIEPEVSGSGGALINSAQLALLMIATAAVGQFASSNLAAAAIALACAGFVWAGIAVMRSDQRLSGLSVEMGSVSR